MTSTFISLYDPISPAPNNKKRDKNVGPAVTTNPGKVLTRWCRRRWRSCTALPCPSSTSRSPDRAGSAWCRAAPLGTWSLGGTFRGRPGAACGCSPARLCPLCRGPPFPRTSRRRSGRRQTMWHGAGREGRANDLRRTPGLSRECRAVLAHQQCSWLRD